MMYSNYAINISVIIGSMMPDFTKTLQFISVTILKIIFKRHTGKAALWTHGLDAWTLGIWTLGLATTGRLDSGHLESGRLEVRALDACALDGCTFGRLYFGRLDAYITD